MGISFEEFLKGRTVRTKKGTTLKIEKVISVSDIVGSIVFDGPSQESLVKYIEHITLLDIDAESLRKR